MKVGIVTKWFNRGQAFVSRYVRDALDARGHETFILARPTKDKGAMAAHIDRTGVWDQPGVTEASEWEVPIGEYESWIAENGIEVVHWDNCYQHEEIAQLRASGVKTVGRFVWEMFSPEDAEPAKAAYDVLYSMTRCEQARYAEMGIESPYVQWGLHRSCSTPPPTLRPPRRATVTTSSASTSRARCSGRASRTRRSSRPSGPPRATTCG